MNRPKILYISQHWPHRTSHASELRAFHLRRALEHIGKVDVVVLDVENGGQDWVAKPSDAFRIAEVLAVETHENRTVREKVRWVFDPYSDHPQGYAVPGEGTRQIVTRSEKYDLVWFSKIRTCSMLARWAWPRSVLDIDDVPSSFETAKLQNGCSPRERALTIVRRWNWERRERLLGERFTTLAVCSENDRRYLQTLGVDTPLHVIPNGFEPPAKEPTRVLATPPRIGFAGLFDYYPNLEGVRWFVEACWPRIKHAVPDARLRLAGRCTGGPPNLSGRDIDWLGWIEDLDSEMDTWSVMVIPLLEGAGTRVKIVLGFSRKCPIVSTTLGAYGYDVRDGEEILLSDRPKQLSDSCLRLIQHPEVGVELAAKANQKFLEKWTWDAIRPRIWAAAEDCLRRSRHPGVHSKSQSYRGN